jgi:hypothetical protein
VLLSQCYYRKILLRANVLGRLSLVWKSSQPCRIATKNYKKTATFKTKTNKIRCINTITIMPFNSKLPSRKKQRLKKMQVLSLIQRASFTLYGEGLCKCSHMWNVTFTQQPDTRTCTLYCIVNPFNAVLFTQNSLLKRQ